MTESGFYQKLLLLKEGWEVKEVNVNHELKEVDVFIEYIKDKAICPVTGELCRIYDRRKNRRWRHLDTINGAIQEIKSIGKGFRNPQGFRTAILFHYGKSSLYRSQNN